VKYGYIAYTYGTLDFDKLRDLTSRVSGAQFEYRRNYKYMVFGAKPLPAPLAQHLELGVIRRKGRQGRRLLRVGDPHSYGSITLWGALLRLLTYLQRSTSPLDLFKLFLTGSKPKFMGLNSRA